MEGREALQYEAGRGQAVALVLEPIQTLPPTVGADEW
jgi:hypothetical protein